MTIEPAKQQAEKASGFMVNADRMEHPTYIHTILVENPNCQAQLMLKNHKLKNETCCFSKFCNLPNASI
jgi:IS1 family transposase